MVRAIVGANWGDEGKGKITDMLAEDQMLLSVSRAAAMPLIQLLMITANLHYIFCHLVSFTIIPQVSSVMAWH